MTERPNDAALVFVVPSHVEETGVCDGEDMWGEITQPPVCVLLHLLWSVDWQQLVRVHCHQNRPRVCLSKQTNKNVVSRSLKKIIESPCDENLLRFCS